MASWTKVGEGIVTRRILDPDLSAACAESCAVGTCCEGDTGARFQACRRQTGGRAGAVEAGSSPDPNSGERAGVFEDGDMGEQAGASRPCLFRRAGSSASIGGRWWGQAIALALIAGASAARVDPGHRLTSSLPSHHRHSASPNGGRAAFLPAFSPPARAMRTPTLRRATCDTIPFTNQRGAPRIGAGFAKARPLRVAMQMQPEGVEQKEEVGVYDRATSGKVPGKIEDMYKDLVSAAHPPPHANPSTPNPRT